MLADSDLLAMLITPSMVARSVFSTRWSCCRAAVAAWIADWPAGRQERGDIDLHPHGRPGTPR